MKKQITIKINFSEEELKFIAEKANKLNFSEEEYIKNEILYDLRYPPLKDIYL